MSQPRTNSKKKIFIGKDGNCRGITCNALFFVIPHLMRNPVPSVVSFWTCFRISPSPVFVIPARPESISALSLQVQRSNPLHYKIIYPIPYSYCIIEKICDLRCKMEHAGLGILIKNNSVRSKISATGADTIPKTGLYPHHEKMWTS